MKKSESKNGDMSLRGCIFKDDIIFKNQERYPSIVVADRYTVASDGKYGRMSK